MTILDDRNLAKLEGKRARNRSEIVATRLNSAEFSAWQGLLLRRQETPAEGLRKLILGELSRSSVVVDPVLSEVIGVRLLLVNLLRSLVCGGEPMTSEKFGQILDQVKTAKRELSRKIMEEGAQ